MRYMKLLNSSHDTVLAEQALLAETPGARRRGLLGTDSLPDGEGLLILPCRQVHTFGMRYPIDVVFIDKDWTVRRVVHRMKPRRLSPLVLASRAVLELPPGKASETATAKGDFLNALPVEK
jgi:uncharacterized protein